MNKTFLLNADLRSAKFLGADPAVRGHWVALQSYCSERETGGVVEGARKFSAREWSVAMGAGGSLRAAERLVLAGFARWEGDSLVLAWYHTESEVKYQQLRKRAAEGGRAKAARERERENRAMVGDLGGARSSGGTASATASANGSQRRGSDGLEEACQGAPRAGEGGSVEAGAGQTGPAGYWDGEAGPDEDEPA